MTIQVGEMLLVFGAICLLCQDLCPPFSVPVTLGWFLSSLVVGPLSWVTCPRPPPHRPPPKHRSHSAALLLLELGTPCETLKPCFPKHPLWQFPPRDFAATTWVPLRVSHSNALPFILCQTVFYLLEER